MMLDKNVKRIHNWANSLFHLQETWISIDKNTLERLANNDPSLISLKLKNNRMGNEGVKALADALTRNSSLTSLSFFNNHVNDEKHKKISSLALNTI